jgi:short-subunit dehydrogenase
MEIRERNILITGANRGIGKAVALRLAADKAHLHIAVRSPDETLKEEFLKAGAASVTFYQSDLSTKAGVAALLKATEAAPIDILFNNAGQLTGGLLEDQPIDDIYSMLQVNVNALIHLTHGFVPRMVKAKRGKIINHASVSGIMNFPCASTYSASKAAVVAFNNCMKAELRGTGVTTLLLITPGVETRMFNQISELYGSKMDLKFLQSIPSTKYAEMIREAIIEDLEILKPSGFSGVSLAIARHLPSTFEKLTSRYFNR